MRGYALVCSCACSLLLIPRLLQPTSASMVGHTSTYSTTHSATHSTSQSITCTSQPVTQGGMDQAVSMPHCVRIYRCVQPNTRAALTSPSLQGIHPAVTRGNGNSRCEDTQHTAHCTLHCEPVSPVCVARGPWYGSGGPHMPHESGVNAVQVVRHMVVLAWYSLQGLHTNQPTNQPPLMPGLASCVRWHRFRRN